MFLCTASAAAPLPVAYLTWEINILDLDFNLELNQVELDTLIITNSGESSLDFDITYDSDTQFSSQFIGEYYSSTGTGGSPEFGELILTREDDIIDFNWGGSSPDEMIPNDDFQIRWTGNIFAEINGEYNFRSYTDDGVRFKAFAISLIGNLFSCMVASLLCSLLVHGL